MSGDLMTREEFRARWNSGDDGGKILNAVLRAAGCDPTPDDTEESNGVENIDQHLDDALLERDKTTGGSPIFFPTPPRQWARAAEKWEPGTWVTKEGRKVKISEMEDRHLVNALRMLKRRGFIGWRTLFCYLRNPGPIGDMALEAFEIEQREVLSHPYHPAFDDLEDEVKRRGFQS